MSTTRAVVTVICDKCGTRLASRWGTPRGARGEARRAGWQVAHVYGGAPSNDPIKGGDRCPECQPEQDAKPEGGLL